MIWLKVMAQTKMLLIDSFLGLREPSQLQDEHAQSTWVGHYLLYVQIPITRYFGLSAFIPSGSFIYHIVLARAAVIAASGQYGFSRGYRASEALGPARLIVKKGA